MESLVVGGGTLVNVHDHRGASFAAEESLEELSKLAFPERYIADLHSYGHKHTYGNSVKFIHTGALMEFTKCASQSN